MKPHELPEVFKRINNGEIVDRHKTHTPTENETQGYLKTLSENLTRELAGKSWSAAIKASSELLRMCHPDERSYSSLHVFGTPFITVGEAELSGFGTRKIQALLDGYVTPGDGRDTVPHWEDSFERADYRIWIGVAFDGENDPLRKQPQFIGASDSHGNIDIQRLTCNSATGQRGITNDYVDWLELMYREACVPENAPELHALVAQYETSDWPA